MTNGLEVWVKRVGAYGICINNGKLLVIDKCVGPYRGRFDLPGGRIEAGETPEEALLREVAEETGLSALIESSLGSCEYLVPWRTGNATHLHHVAMFYRIEVSGGERPALNPRFSNQDSSGSRWTYLCDISIQNASPLVIEASRGETMKSSTGLQRLDDWETKGLEEKGTPPPDHISR